MTIKRSRTKRCAIFTPHIDINLSIPEQLFEPPDIAACTTRKKFIFPWAQFGLDRRYVRYCPAQFRSGPDCLCYDRYTLRVKHPQPVLNHSSRRLLVVAQVLCPTNPLRQRTQQLSLSDLRIDIAFKCLHPLLPQGIQRHLHPGLLLLFLLPRRSCYARLRL